MWGKGMEIWFRISATAALPRVVRSCTNGLPEQTSYLHLGALRWVCGERAMIYCVWKSTY